MHLVQIRQAFGYLIFFGAWIVTDHIPPWTTFFQEMFVAFAIFLIWPWRELKVWPKRLFCIAAFWMLLNTFQYLLGFIGVGDLFLSLCIFVLFSLASSAGAQAEWDFRGRSTTAGSFSVMECWWSILLAAAFFNAIVGLAQWQGVTSGLLMLESSGRAYGNFAQPNHYATLLVLGLLAIILLRVDGQRLSKGWTVLGAGVLLVALVGSESRTGILSFNLAMVTILYFRKKRSAKEMPQLALSFLLIFWVVYISWSAVSGYLGGSVMRSGVGLSPSTRFELWSQMWAAIKLHPLMGYGWLQIGEAQNTVAHLIGGTVNMGSAHNIFIDIVVWYGIPAGGAVIVIVLWHLASRWVKLVKNASASNGIFHLLMLIPIGVHSMLEYPLFYLYFLLVFAFFLGALEASVGLIDPVDRCFRRVMLIVASLSLGVAVYVVVEYFYIEEDFRELRILRDFGAGGKSEYVYRDSPIFLSQYGNLVSLMREDPTDELLVGREKEIENIVFRFPWLMTHQYYYLFLLKNEKCAVAQHQYLVISSLFGDFGLAKIREAMDKYALAKKCESARL